PRTRRLPPSLPRTRRLPRNRRRDATMLIHDWTRVNAVVVRAFHLSWIDEISRALNRGLLPPDYYTLPEQIARGLVPDRLTLHRPAPEPPPAKSQKRRRGGGTAVRTARPKAHFYIPDAPKWYANLQKAVVVRHVSEHRPGAVLEIISPGNKDSRTSLVDFVDKT